MLYIKIIQSFINVELMDLNGDGMLSKAELRTFLIENIMDKSTKGIIQFPVCNIASIKLPHRRESTLSFASAPEHVLNSPFAAGVLDISIPRYVTTIGNGSPYVAYVIQVSAPPSLGIEPWFVERRYRDFDTLRHNLIAETAGNATIPNLPRKQWFPTAESTESRRQGWKTCITISWMIV